jgi:histidinol-phosphate aminotransferase
VDANTRLIFLCSPNNPTSNSLERGAMLEVIKNAPCMVVVDEAYIDFSRKEGLLSLVPTQANLVVLQTLSKAWGLAGIRLGMVFAHPEVVKYLTAVKYPYNVNALTIRMALERSASLSQTEGWVHDILSQRDNLSNALESLSFVKKVFPSDANFLLVRVDDPRQLYIHLMEQGIIIRDRSSVPLCEGCLRITVGTTDENRRLLDALAIFEQSTEN